MPNFIGYLILTVVIGVIVGLGVAAFCIIITEYKK